MDQGKKSTKKLWGKVSSYVSKKIKRNSTTKSTSKIPKDAVAKSISSTNIINKNIRDSSDVKQGRSLTNIFLDNSISKKNDMKGHKSSFGTSQRREQINTSSTAVATTTPTSIYPNTTNKLNPRYDISSNVRPTSPSSYLIKSTLSNRIHDLANEYNVKVNGNHNGGGNTGINTHGNDTDALCKEFDKLAIKKLETLTKTLMAWENSTSHNFVKSAASLTTSLGNRPITNTTSSSDPIDSLISMLNKTESKLGSIETDLLPQSNILKQTIEPLTHIYDNLEELLLHFQNKQMLIDRLEFLMSKIEVKEEVINVLRNMQHYISMALPLANNNQGTNVGNKGTIEKNKNDIDDIVISAVSETLKKLDEIKNELFMFKNMRIIRDTVNELQQYLVEINSVIVNNLFSKDELTVLDAHSISNNSKEIQSQYLKINGERPNLVLLYKMLYSVRVGD